MWKQHPDYSNVEISDLGIVRSIETGLTLDIIPSVDSSGRQSYNAVKLPLHGRRRIATLVMETFVGYAPDGMEIDHKDRNRTNDRLDNLRYLTRLANRARQIRKNQIGERNGSCVLNDIIVKRIRYLSAFGFSGAEISRQLKVADRTVCQVINRKTWTHI